MYIDTLKISGFRGFKHYEALFCPKTNVLIGRNGTGKTTLIHAVIKALSFVFSNDKSMGREFCRQAIIH